MSRRAWLTPETIPADTICRVLYIPDEEQIIAAVVGALLPLTYAFNWEEFGAVTPAAIAARMQQMFAESFVNVCEQNMEVDTFRHQVTTNTGGGSLTANTPVEAPYSPSFDPNNADNVTRVGTVFRVQPGRYYFDMWHVVRGDSNFRFIGWLATSGGTIINEGHHGFGVALNDAKVGVRGVLVATVQTDYVFWIQSSDTLATQGLGTPSNISGHDEVYGEALFMRLGDS